MPFPGRDRLLSGADEPARLARSIGRDAKLVGGLGRSAVSGSPYVHGRYDSCSLNEKAMNQQVLVRLPEWVEVRGDQAGTYVYVANAHDGSMAVIAAVRPVRTVCANALGYALSGGEGIDAQRTFGPGR
jgi:hypothetical protein